jgi:hypothetical protein
MQETPQEYRNRMLAHSQAGDPLKEGAAVPRKLERLLKGVPASKLRKRPAPGKWSIAEIVAHLADAELVRGYRMRMILGAPGTPIQAFNQDDWVAALHYTTISALSANRSRNFAPSANQIWRCSRRFVPNSGSTTACMRNAARKASKPSRACLRATTSITFSRSSVSSRRKSPSEAPSVARKGGIQSANQRQSGRSRAFAISLSPAPERC